MTALPVRGDVVTRPSHATRDFVVLVVLATAILQACWIAVVPPFRGTDEFDHAYRAAAVADGQVRALGVPEDGRGLLVAVPPALVEAAHRQCAGLKYTGPDNCTSPGPAADGTVLIASGAANYNPAFYWVIGTAARPFSGSASLYAMRVAGALLCLFFLGLAAWCVGRRRRTWPAAGLVLAMTPVLVYSTVIPGPNGLEMAAALALWTSLLALARTESRTVATERWLWAVVALSATTVVTLRLLGPLFVLMIVLTVAVLHWSTFLATLRRHLALVVPVAALVALATGLSVAWILVTGSSAPPAQPEGGSAFQGSTIFLWQLQAIAAFPLRNEPGPLAVYVVGLLTVAAFTVAALKVGTTRDRVGVLGALSAAVLLPVVLTLVSMDGRGVIWQGRYGLPYSVGFLLLAGHTLGDRLPGRSARDLLAPAGAALLAVTSTACLVKILTTEAVSGVSAPDSSWHQPPVVLVVLASLLAGALVCVALQRVSRDPG